MAVEPTLRNDKQALSQIGVGRKLRMKAEQSDTTQFGAWPLTGAVAKFMESLGGDGSMGTAG
jgi:hypothetical protein